MSAGVFLFVFLFGAAIVSLAYVLPTLLAPYVAVLGFALLFSAMVGGLSYGQPLAIVAMAGLIAFVAYRFARADGRRRALAALAASQGLAFSRRDEGGLADRSFRLFRSGNGHLLENVLTGRWHGLSVHEADFAYFQTKGAIAMWQFKRWRRFSVLLVDIPADLPRVTVTHETRGSAIGERLGLTDLHFEAESFNRAYRVTSDDREFAYKLVDARMIRWLMESGSWLGFEARGTAVLLHGERLPASRVPALLEAGGQFRDRIPRLVWNEYGTEAGGAAGEDPVS